MTKFSFFWLIALVGFPGLAAPKDLAQLLGHANEFKEGDVAVGVAAKNNTERTRARKRLSQIKISYIHDHPVYRDEQQALIWQDTDPKAYQIIKNWTLGELKTFLLTQPEEKIKQIMPGLDSDVIASVVKLMSNQELIKVGQTVFNPLPDSKIGSKGYMGARIQPNSPTDNPEEIAWQVFNGFSYGVGDVLLGNNPVDSTPESVYRVESTLKDIIETFKLQDILAWCVLAHVDVQQAVEQAHPGSTDLFFQSIGGVEDANKTFGISTQKMIRYATQRKNLKHGFYLETGQGADFTNQHGHGFDMVVHESRKYGLARAMKHQTAWVILNDVAGFIGPEIFKTKEQLVRVCLEDIVMGKLHGLTIGLDICSTLHMSVSLDDLEWCQDQIMPANPAYLMALPTRNDPMLSYLTTSFRDHVRIRNQFGYKINDDMQAFFNKIKVYEHFGDPVWVYTQYKFYKGDKRPQAEIYAEGQKIAQAIQARGVPLDRGQPELDKQIHALYDDAKKSIWTEMSPEFIKTIPNSVILKTLSKNRSDYIGHPPTGEKLSKESEAQLKALRQTQYNVQIVISDGLNANAIMDPGHLEPYLIELRRVLDSNGYHAAPENLIILGGRVRAGYQVGEILFDKSGPDSQQKAVIHIIGERPGNGHQTFSAYIVSPTVKMWSKPGTVDHNHAKLISGISDTSLDPKEAARQTVELLRNLTKLATIPQ